MGLRVVRAVDGIAQRWRNGGGTTVEIARAGRGSPAWRLSRAEIVQDGVFSAFPELQRLQLLCRGNGFVLRFPDGAERRVLPGEAALAYPGAPAPDCRLLDGPCEALNLLWDGGACTAAMERVGLAKGLSPWIEPDDLLAVHVLAGQAEWRGRDEHARLRAGDSLLRDAGPVRGLVLQGCAELAIVRLRPLPVPG
ncbi:HutD family protein [Coralloluteibacterium thermophilus]|uniref:HutD family protein n=1 Tax=Coralloluteibacterium thermophilum TaxID=2707049 RepID=A0ABV9NHJ4_9GAMM